MFKVEMLRAFVNQRLNAAAEEIFAQFERTIAVYEEELQSRSKENHRQQKLLDAVFQPEVHRTDVQQLLMVHEQVPNVQQQWSSHLVQQNPAPPHFKEQQEKLWTSHGGDQLQSLEEANIKFSFTSAPMKSEEKAAQSSQLYQRYTEENRAAQRTGADGEGCRGSEPARISDPHNRLQAATHDSSECDTGDSRGWEEPQTPQSGLNSLQNSEVTVPVNDKECKTGKTSVSSSECAGSFDNLPKHSGAQTEEKTFSCSFCSKKYLLKQHLRRHLTAHTGKKQFICSVCGKTFTDQYNLRRHLTVHTGDKPFTCSVCSKTFKDQSNLRRHFLTVHTGEKPFSCSFCTKRFTQHSDLRRHLTVHTGEKPFSCSVCSKKFTQHSDLRRHLTVHV